MAQAGRMAVTIATNMAGRGTDILLGGNPILAGKMLQKKRGSAGRGADRISRKARARIRDQVAKSTIRSLPRRAAYSRHRAP